MCEALSRAISEQRQHGSLGVIAEIKQRRYKGPDLLRGRSPADIACAYHAAGAAALSVVTSPWFGGTMRMLQEVADAGLGLPILRKDLIGTEKAIQISKHLGASAVLLVLPLLGLDRLRHMLQAAREESLEPFVEVATRSEIEQIRGIYDGIIAINNSDIRTNEIEGRDISRSIELIAREDQRLWVSASRITGPADVQTLAAAGFDGILIGTHLLLADDIRQATCRIVAAARAKDVPTYHKSLRKHYCSPHTPCADVPHTPCADYIEARPHSDAMIRPIVKVCGVTSEEDLQHLCGLGVDFIGLQLDTPTPYAISLDRIKHLAAGVTGRSRATLVTSQCNPDKLAELVRQTGVRAIQLAFLATPRHVRELRRRFNRDDLAILQEIVFTGNRFGNEPQIADYLAAGADYIVIDRLEKIDRSDDLIAQTIPIDDLHAFRERHVGQPILVAGGISADNALAVIEASGAVGVDVCSSVHRDGSIRPELVTRLLERISAEPTAPTPADARPSLRDFLHAVTPGNHVIAYLTLGDPPDRFIDVADEALAAGALTLELGFPFAKPKEGPVLLASHQRALSAGVDTATSIELFRQIADRQPATPLVAVVQWPAIEGEELLCRFLDEVAGAGAAAVLPVGLPLWQLPNLAAHADQRRLQTVIPCPPDASRKFREIVYRYCSGAIYVPRGRVTGGSKQFADFRDFCRLVSEETRLPIVVGVGVRNADDVAEISRTPAVAAAVGSALVDHITKGGSAGEFLRRLRKQTP